MALFDHRARVAVCTSVCGLVLATSVAGASVSVGNVNAAGVSHAQRKLPKVPTLPNLHKAKKTCSSPNPCAWYTNNGAGDGILGVTSSVDAGVYGVNNGAGNGVAGVALSSGAGVYGYNYGSGSGVTGIAAQNGFGVYGSAGAYGDGVYGIGTTGGVGVYGENTGSTPAVQGIADSDGDGVYGSGNGYGNGVYGTNTSSGNGVVGFVSGYGAGVAGFNTATGDGVYGTAPGDGVGLYGQNSGTSISGTGAATAGVANAVIGVYGSSNSVSAGYFSAGSTYASIYSLGVNGSGVYAENNNHMYAALYGQADDPTGHPLFVENSYQKTGFFVDQTGAGTFSGKVYAKGFVKNVPTRDGGAVQSYAAQSAENTLEDTGSGALVNGSGFVRFDSSFARAIDASRGYRVLITPDGDNRGLFVAYKGPAGFAVREAQGGRSSLAFDYRVVAYPLDADAARLPAATVEHQPLPSRHPRQPIVRAPHQR